MSCAQALRNCRASGCIHFVEKVPALGRQVSAVFAASLPKNHPCLPWPSCLKIPMVKGALSMSDDTEPQPVQLEREELKDALINKLKRMKYFNDRKKHAYQEDIDTEIVAAITMISEQL